MTYSITSLTLAAVFNKLTAENSYEFSHLVTKHKLSKFFIATHNNAGSVDMYLPLLLILIGCDIAPMWKLDFILDTLENISIEIQKEILCILSINSCPTHQLAPCNPAQDVMN